MKRLCLANFASLVIQATFCNDFTFLFQSGDFKTFVTRSSFPDTTVWARDSVALLHHLLRVFELVVGI
jgi:hypothetical protein